MENIFGINKKYCRKNQPEEVHHLATSQGGAPLGGTLVACGPPATPLTSTPTPYNPIRGEKNQREAFIAFHDTEPPPPPVLPREGRSGVCFGLRRGEIDAVVITNHPSSPIS